MQSNRLGLATATVATVLLASTLAAAQAAPAAGGGSDHEDQVGHLAVGYLGFRGLRIGSAIQDDNADQTIQAPVIGVRYWLNDFIGIDGGVGFFFGSRSREQEADAAGNFTEDSVSANAFILHGGVPLSLYSIKHFSFQIVPELNLGFGSGSITNEQVVGGARTTVENSASGFHLDLGARAGAEIHFGFIGVPQLSLQGSVGVRLDFESGSEEVVDGPPGSKQDYSRFELATDTYDNPWNIFTGNVAALYYF